MKTLAHLTISIQAYLFRRGALEWLGTTIEWPDHQKEEDPATVYGLAGYPNLSWISIPFDTLFPPDREYEC